MICSWMCELPALEVRCKRVLLAMILDLQWLCHTFRSLFNVAVTCSCVSFSWLMGLEDTPDTTWQTRTTDFPGFPDLSRSRGRLIPDPLSSPILIGAGAQVPKKQVVDARPIKWEQNNYRLTDLRQELGFSSPLCHKPCWASHSLSVWSTTRVLWG